MVVTVPMKLNHHLSPVCPEEKMSMKPIYRNLLKPPDAYLYRWFLYSTQLLAYQCTRCFKHARCLSCAIVFAIRVLFFSCELYFILASKLKLLMIKPNNFSGWHILSKCWWPESTSWMFVWGYMFKYVCFYDTVQLHGQGQLFLYGVRLPPLLLYIYLFSFNGGKNANTHRTEM